MDSITHGESPYFYKKHVRNRYAQRDAHYHYLLFYYGYYSCYQYLQVEIYSYCYCYCYYYLLSQFILPSLFIMHEI